MTTIKDLVHLCRASWPQSGEGFPLTRDPDDEFLFGRENLVVAVALFGLALIFFGVI